MVEITVNPERVGMVCACEHISGRGSYRQIADGCKCALKLSGIKEGRVEPMPINLKLNYVDLQKEVK